MCIGSIYKSMRRTRQYFRAGIAPCHHWPWIKPQIHCISEGGFCVLAAHQLLKFCHKWCREEFKIKFPAVTSLVLAPSFWHLHGLLSWLVTCTLLEVWKKYLFPNIAQCYLKVRSQGGIYDHRNASDAAVYPRFPITINLEKNPFSDSIKD